MDNATLQKSSQIVVSVEIDCPPFDGYPDVSILDIKHPSPSLEDS